MSSSEEYLDSLLRSLTEGDSQTEAGPSEMAEIDSVDMTEDIQEADVSDSSLTDNAMSMNELEAMFASMGENDAEEPQEQEALSDNPELTDSFLADEITLGDGEDVDDIGFDTAESLDELMLDESLMGEESSPDETDVMDGADLEEELLDDLILDESLMPEENVLDEMNLEDDVLDDDVLEGIESEDTTLLDDFVLDESLMPEEQMPEENALGGMDLEEDALEDIEAEAESVLDDFVLDESLMPEESAVGETEEHNTSDDLVLSDLGLDDLNLDDLGMDSDGTAVTDADTDDISVDDFALEESGEDDDDLSALLAGMDSDEDLAEINDLLEKADQGMSDDDDMLAMLGDVAEVDEESNENYDFFSDEEAAGGDTESIREITPEELEGRKDSKKLKKEKKKAEKERKKKDKQERKKGKNKGTQEESGEESTDDELSNLLESMDVTDEKPKKQGFFGRLLEVLLEEDEEDDLAGGSEDAGAELGNLSDENKELLAELKAEDKKNAKKKDKKEKKGKKGKKKDGEAGAEGEGEEGGEAKPKKPKKEKKKKKEKNIEEEPKVPEKKLSKKKVSSIFFFCATIAACIIVLSTLLPTQIEKQEARVAYDYGQYEQVYELLYGKKLSEEDDALLQKSSIILQMRRKLESYDNYMKLDMPLEALNALMEGVNRYRNLRDEAELYRVGDELYDVYEQILSALADSYGVSESEALDILSAEDDVAYSQRLESIVYGDIWSDGEDDLPEVKQDVLPEEEEIIDRLQGVENTEESATAPQAESADEVMQAEEEALAE